MLDPGLGHWLAGFWDGEGCFVIKRHQNGNTFICLAVLRLRDDDSPILHQLSEATGIGRVLAVKERPGARPQATWTIQNQADCLALVEIFDAYPLRAKKAHDFVIWREAVKVWADPARRRGVRWPRKVYEEMETLHEALTYVRSYGASLALAKTLRTPATVE